MIKNEIMDKLFEEGQKISKIMEKAKNEYEAKNEDWWENLSYEDRCHAFYAVTKRIFEGDIVECASYRKVLYDIFGFGPEMYVAAMDSGYIAIHNAIVSPYAKERLMKSNKQI
jgi:hypothetical protein